MKKSNLLLYLGGKYGMSDLAGNTITNSGVTITEGVFGGKALKFSKSYINIPYNENFNGLNNADFTIAYWYYLSSGNQYSNVFGQNNRYGTSIHSHYGGNNYPYLNINGETNDGYDSHQASVAYSSGWNHIAWVHDGATDTHYLYINGVLGLTLSNGNTINFSNSDSGTEIGWDGFQDNSYLYGTIDDFVFIKEKLWDSEFTPPTKYLSFNKIVAVDSSGNIYGCTSSTESGKIGEGWGSKTSSERLALFDNVSFFFAPKVSDLKEIGDKFKIVYDSVIDESNKQIVTAIPNPQLVLPTALISTKNYESVNSASFSGGGSSGNVVLAHFDDWYCATGEKIVKQAGSPTINTTLQKFGNGCLEIDSSSYATVENDNFSKLHAEDFTIEFWANIKSNTQSAIFNLGCNTSGSTSNYDCLQINIWNTNAIHLYASYSGSSWDIDVAFPVAESYGVWDYYAIVREGEYLNVYKNGTRVINQNIGASTSLYFATNKLALGKGNYTTNALPGYYDELRVTIGKALYSGSTMTVPNEPFSDNGFSKIRLAVTPDLSKYYVYDTASAEWVEITTDEIATKGMSLSKVEALTYDEWAKLVTFGTKDGGFAFAYYLGLESTDDSLYLDELSLNVDMVGAWNKAVYGTDYTYGYPSHDKLQVKLLTDGSYKINFVR